MSAPTFPERSRPWQRGVAELALACAGSFAAEESSRLRDLIALLQSCPAGIEPGLALPQPERLDELLGANAAAAAVLELFHGVPAGYLLSHGGEGRYLASVMLPGARAEANASGDTAALALLGAVALALADLPDGAAGQAELAAPDGTLLN